MAAFKTPTFQDRVAAAAVAKQNALDRLKAKPPVDAAVAAAKRQAWEKEQQALADDRAAKAATKAAAKAAKAAASEEARAAVEAAAALKAQRLTPPSAADMKAARDARYASRQNRKK